MKISDLITKLEKVKEKEGDIEVATYVGSSETNKFDIEYKIYNGHYFFIDRAVRIEDEDEDGDMINLSKNGRRMLFI